MIISFAFRIPRSKFAIRWQHCCHNIKLDFSLACFGEKMKQLLDFFPNFSEGHQFCLGGGDSNRVFFWVWQLKVQALRGRNIQILTFWMCCSERSLHPLRLQAPTLRSLSSEMLAHCLTMFPAVFRFSEDCVVRGKRVRLWWLQRGRDWVIF